MDYLLEDFDYHLPKELIAQTPASPRDSARLLVYDKASGKITDAVFSDIDKYLVKNTTLVLNNSKVDKRRLIFGSFEVFVSEILSPTLVRALVRPGEKFKLGAEVPLANDFSVKVEAIDDEGIRTLSLSLPFSDKRLAPYKQTPFPPYIKQDEHLAQEYQTVYAKPLGSAAAPTAGLHFTPELLKELKSSHRVAELTLHVGLGTFAPVRSSITKHKMHSEWFEISAQTAEILNNSKHITAVGTTSVRTLESVASGQKPGARRVQPLRAMAGREALGANNQELGARGQELGADRIKQFSPLSGQTDIFIQPGYEFKAVDSLITNFHLPKSTLLMLVAAFMGYDEMREVYRHAITSGYRFYSFGDAMLVQ